MAGSLLDASRRAEAAQLERRLHQIDADVARLERERDSTRHRLEALRLELTICPKCGRDHDFLTDEGGVLIHVLEDPKDTELLAPQKPLYCPDCGEVFLYAGGAAHRAPVPPRAVRRLRP